MKQVLWLFLLLSFETSAQVADFLPTQKTISKPFGLPIKIDLDGKISFSTGDRDLVFGPAMQIGFETNEVQYSLPEMASEFSFRPPGENSGWMEYKRRRYDVGVGLISAIQQQFRLGIAPYKGSRVSMRRLKQDKDSLTSNDLSMPKTLSDIEQWSTGDEGTWQTYGGIQIYAGLDLGPVNPLGVTVGWQNQFIVSIQKKDNEITLTITEEGLDRIALKAGIEPLNGTLMRFQGKQLRAEFTLDFSNPVHHELYLSALKGELNKVEEKLSPEKRKMKWVGNDMSYYLGIPWLVGNTRSQGSYKVTEEKQEYFLEVIQNRRAGLLVSKALQQKFVYHNQQSILLMWSTDMKKSSARRLDKHFFGPARAVGFKGFDLDLDPNVHYGTVIAEVGVVITKDDIDGFSQVPAAIVSERLLARCTELALKCRSPKANRSIMKRYLSSMKEEWETRKKSLGLLLVKEPALLHALMKESRLSKEAYFKFLSDRYQSLEGLTALSF